MKLPVKLITEYQSGQQRELPCHIDTVTGQLTGKKLPAERVSTEQKVLAHIGGQAFYYKLPVGGRQLDLNEASRLKLDIAQNYADLVVINPSGKVEFRGDNNACFTALLKMQSCSVDTALKHQGWKIKPAPEATPAQLVEYMTRMLDIEEPYRHIYTAWSYRCGDDNLLGFDDFFNGYKEAALFAEIGDDDEPLDASYAISDIQGEENDIMRRDCIRFIALNGDALLDVCHREGYSYAQAGRDLWFNRNGHGVGYWDRDLGELGEELSEAARDFGGCDIYIGDDKKLYVTSYCKPLEEFDRSDESGAPALK